MLNRRRMASLAEARDPQTFAVIGAAMAVHAALGCGFLESVYRAALSVELRSRCIPFRTEVAYRVAYCGQDLPVYFRADLVCFDAVIVEVKAARGLAPTDEAQAINYLKVSRLQRALLLNFGGRSLEFRRIVLTVR
jgi:GxxExxY protein